MWSEDCALPCGSRIVWEMGHGHPQLSNGLWGAPTVTLTMPSPPVFKQGKTLPVLARKIWGRYLFGDCLLESKKLSVLPVQWKVYNSFTNLFCSKEGKQPIKSDLLKQSLSVVKKVINTGKWNLTTHDSGKQEIFLFFFQISQEGTFASSRQGSLQENGAATSSPAVPESLQVPRDHAPACSQFDPT